MTNNFYKIILSSLGILRFLLTYIYMLLSLSLMLLSTFINKNNDNVIFFLIFIEIGSLSGYFRKSTLCIDFMRIKKENVVVIDC